MFDPTRPCGSTCKEEYTPEELTELSHHYGTELKSRDDVVTAWNAQRKTHCRDDADEDNVMFSSFMDDPADHVYVIFLRPKQSCPFDVEIRDELELTRAECGLRSTYLGAWANPAAYQWSMSADEVENAPALMAAMGMDIPQLGEPYRDAPVYRDPYAQNWYLGAAKEVMREERHNILVSIPIGCHTIGQSYAESSMHGQLEMLYMLFPLRDPALRTAFWNGRLESQELVHHFRNDLLTYQSSIYMKPYKSLQEMIDEQLASAYAFASKRIAPPKEMMSTDLEYKTGPRGGQYQRRKGSRDRWRRVSTPAMKGDVLDDPHVDLYRRKDKYWGLVLDPDYDSNQQVTFYWGQISKMPSQVTQTLTRNQLGYLVKTKMEQGFERVRPDSVGKRSEKRRRQRSDSVSSTSRLRHCETQLEARTKDLMKVTRQRKECETQFKALAEKSNRTIKQLKEQLHHEQARRREMHQQTQKGIKLAKTIQRQYDHLVNRHEQALQRLARHGDRKQEAWTARQLDVLKTEVHQLREEIAAFEGHTTGIHYGQGSIEDGL